MKKKVKKSKKTPKKEKKEKKVRKEKPAANPKEAPIDITIGLDQGFRNKKGNVVYLDKFLKKAEWWTLKRKDRIAVILTHNAVKRIADEAGIKGDPKYEILTQPSYTNNFQYLIQATICDQDGRCTSELGESNRSNLGSRGRQNPANMAQKRAYDRAVLRHLGIEGILGEDELEEEKEVDVKTLSPEQAKSIAPLINRLLSVKKKSEIDEFNREMKTKASSFQEEQLSVLRNLRDKKLGELTSTF